MTHGSHNIRKPGSIGASATPSRVFKGMKMAGRMGGKRVTQVGLTRPRGRPRAEPAARQGRRARARRTASSRSGRRRVVAAPKAPLLDAAGKKSKDVDARRGDLRRRGQAAPRPRGGSRRAERAPRRHARREEPRARRRRPREAVAPEGHRPRPRRARSARRSSTGGGVAFPPTPRSFDGQGQPEGPQGRAARGALRARRRRDARLRRRRRLRRALDEAGRRRCSRPGARSAARSSSRPRTRRR